MPLRTAWLEIGAGFQFLFAAAAAYALPPERVLFRDAGVTSEFAATLMLLGASAVFALHPLAASRHLRRLLFAFAGLAAAFGAAWFFAAGGHEAVAVLQSVFAIWLLGASAVPWLDRGVVAIGERRAAGIVLALGTALIVIGLIRAPSADGVGLASVLGAAVLGAALIVSELRWSRARVAAAAAAAACFFAYAVETLMAGDAAAAASLMAAAAWLLLTVAGAERMTDAVDALGATTPRQGEIMAVERAAEATLWTTAAFAAVFVNFIPDFDARLYYASVLAVALVAQIHYRLLPATGARDAGRLAFHAVVVLASLALIEATGGPLGPFMPLGYLAVFGSGFIAGPALSAGVACLYAAYVGTSYLIRYGVPPSFDPSHHPAEYLFVMIVLVGIGLYTAWNGRRRVQADQALLSANARLAAALKSAIRERERMERQTRELKGLNENLVEMRSALMNVLEDVEESKRQIELERRREKASFNALAEGVIAAGVDGDIFLCNPKAAELLGVTESAVLGKRIERVLRLFAEDGAVMQTGAFESAFAGEVAPFGGRLQIVRDDGGRVPVAGTAAPYRDEEDRLAGVVVVFRDVTIEREIDRQKSDFISIASHQLRTPLSALRWFLDMLLAGDAGPIKPKQREYLGDMSVSVVRMIKLVGDLLSVTRIESGRIKPVPTDVDTHEFIDSISREHMPLMRQRSISFNTSIAADARTFYADPALARQAVVNVLTNALMYTPSGGRVTLKAETEGDETVFEVGDTGFGIPKAQQHRVFDKFFRGENAVMRETKGSGLGLYVTKTIVDLSGGRIRFVSDEKKGTVFRLAFPNGPKALPQRPSGGTLAA